MKMQIKALIAAACGGLAGAAALPAAAGDAPLSFEANPGIYKVLAENEHMRVVLATWQPGQKDTSHSHPKAAFYTIKDCHARITTPDGNVREVHNKAGTARINPPVVSHTFDNIGTTECQQVFVELKK